MRHLSPLCRLFWLAVVPVSFLACAPAPSEKPAPAESILAPWVPSQLVDLTHAFGEETIYWPTETRGFELEVLAEGHTDHGYYYAANRFSSAEHGGTHLDAPIHFFERRDTTDKVPLARLIAPGVVVDVSEQAAADADYQIRVADFTAWEDAHGRLPSGVIVLLRTGFADRWPDRASYLGTERLGPEAVPELHFPGLSPEAASWLVEREILAVGIDTASIDYGQSTLFEAHVTLFEADIPAFENVAALDRLPVKGFLVIALPMKIAGGSGGPLRIVAAW